MEYRNLGASGLQVSVVGLGCNNFGRRCDLDATTAVVNAALDAGVSLFDTADVYGPGGASEEYLGQALAGKRQDVVLATKFAAPMGEGPYRGGGSRRYVYAAVEASLRRLGTDYIDLYQVHFPDPKTPLEETMRALDDIVRSGNVRYIGCSNFAGWQIADAAWIGRSHGFLPFISAQNQYSLLDRRIEREVIPSAQRFGLGILPYFPLANGFLTGKYKRGEGAPAGTRLSAPGAAERVLTDANFDVLDALEGFAGQRGRSLLELAIGWLASNPAVSSVIAGATKPEQVRANVEAAAFRLTAEEMGEVNRITRR